MNLPAALDANSPRLAGAAVAIIGLTILARAFGGPGWLVAVLIAGASLLVLSGFRTVPARLRNTALILFALTVLLLPFAKAPLTALQRGVFISGQLLALISSVMLLAQCALKSPRIQRVGASLRAQRGHRRYLAFTVVSQLYSSMLSMAGAHIMLVMAAPKDEAPNPRRTEAVVAVTRGFALAGFWSPVFGNMVILLALYPSLHWAEVFPIGLGLAQLAMTVGIVLNRLERRRNPIPSAEPQVMREGGTLIDVLPLLLAMLCFMGVTLALSKLLSISISSTIVLLAPLSALGIHLVTGTPGKRWFNARSNLGESIRNYPRLASEAMLFMAAGCAGSILADAFPLSWTQQIGAALSGMPLLGLAFLMTAIMGIALAGIHPVLTVVFLASTLSPEVLNLPPVTHMAALLIGWGLSATLTPFSVLSLTAARYAGTSLYQISLGRNWLFALVNMVVMCILLTAVTIALR